MLFQPNFSPRCIFPRRFHRGSRARQTIHGLRIKGQKNVVLSSADFTAVFCWAETMYGQRAAACPKTALKMLYLPAPISPRLFSGGDAKWSRGRLPAERPKKCCIGPRRGPKAEKTSWSQKRQKLRETENL